MGVGPSLKPQPARKRVHRSIDRVYAGTGTKITAWLKSSFIFRYRRSSSLSSLMCTFVRSLVLLLSCRIFNNAILDYTSLALCTPVTPFPPIGDAAHCQQAGAGPRHVHGQHAHKNLVQIARELPEISSRTDRHTDRQTHHNTSQPLTRAKY